MRLNHLEISGFKSFPERAELAFDDGVTAIVGPNGCGKSNVIDAITWVLGEQSARSLRGERMEDVIFGGSDARRPTAAAEVRLQLSEVTAALAKLLPPARGNGSGGGNVKGHGDGNGHGNGAGRRFPEGGQSDGSQDVSRFEAGRDDDDLDSPPTIARDVEVSRRLYRSGESEYLIDGQVCRLRDIQDLLMDSGIGMKAYAVIEQGKIGQILGARPMERRQLIEEAAGVTKYKSRRRSAELKLEAAQQNLTRVDDIVFEVKRQRSALKRQAARARRYRRLREELRRWEKVLFARKNESLRLAIEAVQCRLVDARARDQLAAGRLVEFESDLQRFRIELTEADQRATAARDTAHTHEIEVGRCKQQVEFDKNQVSTLADALTAGEAELLKLEARRAPLRAELGDQLTASQRCHTERDVAADRLRSAESTYAESQRSIEAQETDVEASRDEVFSAIQSAMTLRHIIDQAADGRNRVAGELARLESEAADVALELKTIDSDHQGFEAAVCRVREALETARLGRADRDAELASAHIEHKWRARDVRVKEHELASMSARLTSLKELDAARAEYGSAARLLLAQSGGSFSHLGSVADHLEVDRGHERAVEACLGELLQCIVVNRWPDVTAGIEIAKSENAGRCGFLVAEAADPEASIATPPDPALQPLSELVRINGPGASAVRRLLARRWLAPSLEAAEAAAKTTDDQITTPEGIVLEGRLMAHSGGKREALGILATKGEIKEIGRRMALTEATVQCLNEEIATFAGLAERAEIALSALHSEEHKREKELLGLELQLARLGDERTRGTQKQGVVETDQRKALEEYESLESKQAEAHESIARLKVEQQVADERLNEAQRKLFEARQSIDTLGQRVSDRKAEVAALDERMAGVASDVTRLEDAVGDLEPRISARASENSRLAGQRESVTSTIANTEHRLVADVKTFELLCSEVRLIDDRSTDLQSQIDALDGEARTARQALETERAELGQLEVRRATAESDLAHLETSCVETLQLTLAQACREVEQFECELTPETALVDGGVEDAEFEVADAETGDVKDMEASTEPLNPPETAVQAIEQLRAKIQRLGPVNMMAIDQFDELEQRYEFLTTQRQDLLDAIQETDEAIKRIDITTRERFHNAFNAVNENFKTTFSTLFGGGRAGLVLLDESNLLESAIDIIAQPPGKRLQNMQLLSGGEKALTAMALMFAIFRYRPSPFCLLDEIDAPLDDANVGRFVEMLRGMQDHTQFVLVTHNRKTMENADRLYGVTMEEPGVSKLISVKFN